jgi:hypothetical protein
VLRNGAVRILRTPQELSEAINRAQEFERRNAEVMRSRSQRYLSALGVPPTAADRVTPVNAPVKEEPSGAAPAE